jgi:2-phospho-L-lactate guanylyltransferase
LTSLAILVPVKSSGLKSRLSGVLSTAKRSEFTRLLLTDLLAVLSGARLLGNTYVVSPDRQILRLAGRLGAGEILESKDRGVNAAVIKGLSETGPPDSVLVLPSDLPLLQVSEVRGLLGLRSSGFRVVVTPSRGFNGTNALLYSTSSGLALSYDDNSFWNHLSSAAQNGLATAVSCRPGLMFDVDTPDDLRELASVRSERRSVAFARRHSG